MNTSDVRTSIYQKTGGFIKGICHPKGETARLTDAGIGWVRMDAPYPFEKDGSVCDYHLSFLEEIRNYSKKGLRAILISPYPDTFLDHGVDPRSEEGLREVKRICAFMAKEYAPLGVCWQATNEMHIVHFRSPLTVEESKEFLVASLQGLREGNPNAAIGHNSISHTGDWDALCREIDSRTDCDYIGFDLYNGTWSDGGPETFTENIERLYNLVKKPVILMEFGFSSRGGNISEDRHEITDYLANLGYMSLEALFASPDRFLDHLPEQLNRMVRSCAPEDKETALCNCFPHLLKKWCATEVFPHTEEGQATFYRTLLPILLENPHLAGAVIYCWRDSDDCFSCKATDCPCETAWGLVHLDESEKPAYYAVREIYTGKKSS